jgi:hypothetical protein
MNVWLMMVATSVMFITGWSRADAWKDALQGGLIGAAAGGVVAELSDDDARYTIPLFASIGALTGYAIHEDRHHHHRYGYTLPYLALPYSWYVWRRPTRHVYRSNHPTKKPVITQTPIDRHPGVSRITVPITLKNGTVLPIHLFKIGNTYTGPQGETYTSRPDATTLQERYSP